MTSMRFRVLTVALLITTHVAAQEAPVMQVVTYPPGDDKITVLRKGDAAPYTGQLYDDNTSVRWAIWLQQYKGRYALDLKAVEDSCQVKLDADSAIAKALSDRNAAVEADAVKRLKDSETARLQAEEALRNPSFFDRPGVWFGVGVATTILTAVATGYLVHASTK